VRQALIHATNKKAIVDTLQSGVYQEAFGPLSRITFGYDKRVETGGYTFDMNGARALLEEAGWTLGADGIRTRGGQPLKLTYISLNANRDPQQGELLQALWKAAGIDLEIQVFPGFAQESAAIAANAYHVVPGWWVQSDPTVLTQIYHSRNVGVNNWSKSAIPELDRLLEQGDSEPDTARRAAIFGQVQKAVMDHALSVPVWDHADIVVTRASLDGLVFDRRGQYFWLYDAYLKS
jgi:peptide/nickel transport system substrate-binding protein